MSWIETIKELAKNVALNYASHILDKDRDRYGHIQPKPIVEECPVYVSKEGNNSNQTYRNDNNILNKFDNVPYNRYTQTTDNYSHKEIVYGNKIVNNYYYFDNCDKDLIDNMIRKKKKKKSNDTIVLKIKIKK